LAFDRLVLCETGREALPDAHGLLFCFAFFDQRQSQPYGWQRHYIDSLSMAKLHS